jgi:hypothetical protein
MRDPVSLSGCSTKVGAISIASRADFQAMKQPIALHGLRPVKEAYR